MHTVCTQHTYQMQTKCIYFACIRIANPRINLSHSHLLVVSPERPAVDKLLAEEVLVPYVKAAEDLNLRPLATTPAALVTSTLLHAPHQQPNLTFGELIAFRWIQAARTDQTSRRGESRSGSWPVWPEST